jgi:hypothetical protein
MKTATESNRVNRRAALAGLGATGLGASRPAEPRCCRSYESRGASMDHRRRISPRHRRHVAPDPPH